MRAAVAYREEGMAVHPRILARVNPMDRGACKIMASGPITSWEINGETVETVTDFFGSKITADDDCSHEIKGAYSLEGKL